MRVPLFPLIALTLTTVACSPPQPKKSEVRDDSDRRIGAYDDSAARKAGHAAYGAAQETKKLAEEAAHKLRKAGEEAHKGWKDAQRENRDKRQ